jgi:hypothetical protein
MNLYEKVFNFFLFSLRDLQIIFHKFIFIKFYNISLLFFNQILKNINCKDQFKTINQ